MQVTWKMKWPEDLDFAWGKRKRRRLLLRGFHRIFRPSDLHTDWLRTLTVCLQTTVHANVLMPGEFKAYLLALFLTVRSKFLIWAQLLYVSIQKFMSWNRYRYFMYKLVYKVFYVYVANKTLYYVELMIDIIDHIFYLYKYY